MAQWISFQLRPYEAADVFLARAVRPFLERHIWMEKGARAFFVRAEDEQSPIIRLRLYGDADALRVALSEAMDQRAEVEENTYQPETERFGGPAGLRLAEEHFHLSSRAVLDRLNRPYTYGDALYDGLRLHTIAAFAAGFEREKAAWYFGQLCDQWLPVFFRPVEGETFDDAFVADIKAGFEKSFLAQEVKLRSAVDALWRVLTRDKFDNDQPEWLRWTRGNQLIFKEMGENLETALPSLLHLTNNRLGIANPDEVYLNYILSSAL